MLTIYVIRHGQTEWNLARRMQGRMDSPLTGFGERQADIHGRTLLRLGSVDEIIASPLGRTRATADLVNVHLDVPVRWEAALMERDCGDWSGLTIPEAQAAWPEIWQQRERDPFGYRPPGGENHDDMERRVAGLLAAVLDGAAQRVALITHGVMSRVILKHLLALPPAQAAAVRHPNELFYRLELDPPRIPARAVSHFILGRGPESGLLRQNDSETIPDPNLKPDVPEGSEHES